MRKSYLYLLLFFVISNLINAQKFEVSYDIGLIDNSFSGQVLLYLSKTNKTPKDVFVGLESTPIYRVSVTNLKPNETIVFDDSAISYPVELSNIERGDYYVQAVIDQNLGGQHIGSSPGNIYSKPTKISITKDFNSTFKINCNQLIGDIDFQETTLLKELKIKSKLLSDFHGKDIFIAGAISLPKDYFESETTEYPVIFSVFGYGANYKLHAGKGKYKFTNLGDKPVIVVYLDGNCPEGHSTYANSDINGPWGDALVNEFIPALEKTYRTNRANLLFGHSSGGWTVLWLQINYPKTFVGAWSSAPDQVDFRNYQNKNIYEINNMYYDEQGNYNADITIAGRFPVAFTKDLYQTEHVVYRGEQMHSFDAVFSSIDKEGNKIRLVNPINGNINKDAIKYFKRYDISLLLRNNWNAYKNSIEGKIRISVGEHDNFYLNKAVHLLDDEMKKLNANMEFEYYDGDHFTVFTNEYQEKGLEFLESCYNNWLNK